MGIDEVVMVKILNVTDLGATCCLLEYNDIEGFIASSDYSRKRIRSVKKLMRVGKQEVLQVLRVDEEKGYVDLSKKLLMPKDIEECSERYEKSKIVKGILRRLAETRNENVSVPYEAFGWAMFEGDEGHAFDVLQSSLLDGSVLERYKVPEEYREPLLAIVRHRMSTNPIKVEAEINLTCFGRDGVDALKASLIAGREVGTEETPITVTVKASPCYCLSATNIDKSVATELVNKAIEAVKASIATSPSGAMEIKSAPKVITA